MLCPNCNTEVVESKFCENCGAALTSETAEQPADPIEQPEAQPEQPTIQLDQPEAQPEQPTIQLDQPEALPEQPAVQTEQPTAQYQQPTYQAPQPGAYAPMPAQAPASPEPSGAPFVLAIIALVTALLGMFPISIILAIIALVMNSGQKKRGEFSTKQTPTFVMSLISLILSVIIALVITLIVGVIGIAAVNGDFDDISFSSSNALSTSSSASSNAKPGALIADTDDLVGHWTLSSLVKDGEKTNLDKIDMNLEVTLDLDNDGSATLTLFGVETKGTWAASTPDVVRLTVEGETIACDVDTDTAELTLAEGDDEITFTKD